MTTFLLGVCATLIVQLPYGSFSTNQLVKPSGYVSGINDDLLRVYGQVQILKEETGHTHLATQRLNSLVKALTTESNIFNGKRKLVNIANRLPEGLARC